MSFDESAAAEPQLATRGSVEEPEQPPRRVWTRRLAVGVAGLVVVLALVGGCGFLFARHWLQTAAKDALPQIDGSMRLAGLQAAVTVQRDAHGVPHVQAQSLDDLYVAQGFITAQDRLFQMDLLRRHAAGELAEVMGAAALGHDRLQRTLQVRAAADRAVAQLPAGQRHMLERYAAGVNAAIAADGTHLPVEFRILRYKPAPWTPRDSVLVWLAIYEDLTNTFPAKLAREGLVARLPADRRAELEQDLYPVGSWRDHPPGMVIPDLTVEGPPIPDVPLDESQFAELLRPLSLERQLSNDCTSCTPGSNNWVVSGAHTASGKPLLANDMHLAHTLPGIWYEADLEAGGFHVAGVALPGVPLMIVGHNDHIAWGITNLGGDVQDVYLETTRGTGAAEEFQATDGSWQPVLHLREPIKVHGGKDVAFEVLATRHGEAVTPILNPTLTPEVTQAGGVARTLALRWTIYDPGAVNVPTLEVNSAHDWASFLAASRNYGGPAQNVVYADDQGHIGYQMVGKIPLRGAASAEDTAGPNPMQSGAISPVPVAPSAATEWTGYIPFDELPQVYDPAGGVIATANARTAPDGYGYAITQNWGAPYRNERIWRLLAHRKGLVAGDMLAIQTDVDSEFDRVLAERLTYALDHAGRKSDADAKTLRQAADLLRTFKGRMSVDSGAASIVYAVHSALWTLLLAPQVQAVKGKAPEDFNALYVWGERDYALEQILMHTPPRWLPKGYADWNEFLAEAVLGALKADKAPADLSRWAYGGHRVVDIEHPVFAQSEELRQVLKMPTGTGPRAQSGDGTTIKQVGRTFGPSERFTADLGDLDRSTLNIVTGQSGNLASPWFLDQFPFWYKGATLPMPYSAGAAAAATVHRLTLTP